MVRHWFRKLLGVWPLAGRPSKRAQRHPDLPEVPPRFESGRANFRPVSSAPRQGS
jgi:hypothetical protein